MDICTYLEFKVNDDCQFLLRKEIEIEIEKIPCLLHVFSKGNLLERDI